MPTRLKKYLSIGYPIEKKVEILDNETVDVDLIVDGKAVNYEIVVKEGGIFLHKKQVQRYTRQRNESLRY